MKFLMFLLITAVLGITLVSVTFHKNSNHLNDENVISVKSPTDPRIDFIMGQWTGTGFLTDANGLQQYIEIEENNTRVSIDEYKLVGLGKNPNNGFVYSYTKKVYFNNRMNAWYIKGKINENDLKDSRFTIGENNILSYSYYDLNSILVRQITARESDDSFTESQEKMGANGWDKTAWFRMKRNIN